MAVVTNMDDYEGDDIILLDPYEVNANNQIDFMQSAWSAFLNYIQYMPYSEYDDILQAYAVGLPRYPSSGAANSNDGNYDSYSDPNVLGVVNIYADNPGQGTWSTLAHASNEYEMDGLSTAPLHGFGNDYDAIGAYQTQQTLYDMDITTTSYGLYASSRKGNSLYSNVRNWFYKMHGVNRNARNSKDGLTPLFSPDYEKLEGANFAPTWMNKYHDNGDAHPEHKLLFSDGREYIYTDMSQNHDMSVLIPMNDPEKMGTYNYVNPMDWREIFAPLPIYGIPIAPSIYVGRTTEFTIRSTGHFLTDMLPYYIWGNVEGVPNE